tara:strand:- start:2752 stop:3315 length:564 start_codon:yes stop_codon:yes gene_type:complete
MKVSKERILMVVADHLGLDNVVQAFKLRRKSAGDLTQLNFAVGQIKNQGEYYDVMIWLSIKSFQSDNRPKCDHRVRVDLFGQLYKKKRVGRRKAVIQKEMVSFTMHPRDVRLVDEVSHNRSELLRRAVTRAVYLEHLMWIYKDPHLHTRPVSNGYGLYKGDGSCISTHKEEISLLLNLLPYTLLLSR